MKLNVNGHQWFSYEDKNVCQIKVMARGLHTTCAGKYIIVDMANKGLKILGALIIIKKKKVRINDERGSSVNTKRGHPLS